MAEKQQKTAKQLAASKPDELEIRLSLIKKAVLKKDSDELEHVEHFVVHITDQDLCEEIHELLGTAIAEQTDVKSHPEDLDGYKFELDGVSWAEKQKKLKAEKGKEGAA